MSSSGAISEKFLLHCVSCFNFTVHLLNKTLLGSNFSSANGPGFQIPAPIFFLPFARLDILVQGKVMAAKQEAAAEICWLANHAPKLPEEKQEG